jgi:hypothetical protein
LSLCRKKHKQSFNSEVADAKYVPQGKKALIEKKCVLSVVLPIKSRIVFYLNKLFQGKCSKPWFVQVYGFKQTIKKKKKRKKS